MVALYLFHLSYPLFDFRLTGVCRLSSCIRARLQKTCSLRHPHSENPRKASSDTSWGNRNHSAPSAQRLSGCTRRPQVWRQRRMQDVVCQLVGIGMVQGYAMYSEGLDSTLLPLQIGEKFHMNSIIHHVWGMLPPDIHDLYHCRLVLPAVHR